MTDTPHTSFSRYASSRRKSVMERLGAYRLVRYKLVVPLLRTKQPPEYVARGVMVGVVSAMTPLVGVQMMIVGAAWSVLDRMMSWRFSLVQGLTWTWITNVFTMIPVYYVFFLTGQVMLGRVDEMSGYDSFTKLTQAALDTPGGFVEKTWAWCITMLGEWGAPMVVGCVPWAIGLGWLSYYIALRVMRRRRARLSDA